MIIAVNTRKLFHNDHDRVSDFILETFQRITRAQSQHRFILIADTSIEKSIDWPGNVETAVVGPPARNPILWKFWYDIKIPAFLKKHKADVFVSTDGLCSLSSKIPQCLVIHDLGFLHHPLEISKPHLLYYKRYTPKSIAKARSIATVSSFMKNDIIENYNSEAEKITVVYSGIHTGFSPLSYEERRGVKEKYTEGKEYFLFTGTIGPRKNLINLLKAFTVFKKRQQSKMKLVIAGPIARKYESFTRDLQSYKYRDEVVLTGSLQQEELEKITGAAYAMVCPSVYEGFGEPILEAMRCEVPVITSPGSAMQEIAGEAALYADPDEPASIAERMMLLYKDENRRSQLIQRASNLAGNYSWDKTANLLWECIEKAIG